MSTEVNLTITGEIQRLHVGPKDVVVVKLIADRPIREADFERVNRQLQTRLAALEWIDRIIVIDGHAAEISVLEGANS